MLTIAGGILLGLLVGSFLNVVAYRLPVMMQREWDMQTLELAGQPIPEQDAFNLIVPRSRCPACKTAIPPWHNIPVLSWLILRGKCRHCATAISARYPLVELGTGLLSGLIIWKFGFSAAGIAGLFFLWVLISLSLIDIDHQLLPDRVTYLLLWSGLTLALFHPLADNLPFPDLRDSVVGAIAGYLSLWSVYWLFKLVTGKEGMGYGDFKLSAALGAWLGWQMLPLVIFLSAAVGAILGFTMIMMRSHDRQVPIPFGPYLAGAGLIALLWGREISNAYLGYSAV